MLIVSDSTLSCLVSRKSSNARTYMIRAAADAAMPCRAWQGVRPKEVNNASGRYTTRQSVTALENSIQYAARRFDSGTFV